MTHFETTDVTLIAKTLVGCVSTSNQRYGVNVILDTVRGANTAKIRQYRMERNVHYGKLADISVPKLRQVINHLMLKEYLIATDDEYAIVKLTEQAQYILTGEEAIIMKMAKEQAPVVKEKSSSRSKKGSPAGVTLSGEEEALFEALRTLRRGIAGEEKVPPYIVFSDKTLVHMCVEKPGTKEEMLNISGVGEFKFEKYGERFLEAVRGG